MEHFNKLTPAQLERLALAAEEMGEAIQIIGKILRHGLDSQNPLVENGPTNKELLEKELGDVRCAVRLLCVAGDIDDDVVDYHASEKISSLERWLHHQ